MSLRRLATVTLYLIVVFAFFEVSARAFLSRRDLFRRVAGVDEASSRLRWAARQDRRPLTQPFDVYHPVRGWTLRPGLRDEAAFDGRRLSSNERGYRGAREVSESKPAGQRRVAVLGDSFTFGEDVGDQETWVHQLGALDPGLEPSTWGFTPTGTTRCCSPSGRRDPGFGRTWFSSASCTSTSSETEPRSSTTPSRASS